MTKEQLLAIAQRHAEDHRFHSHEHPRRDSWAADAVGDRGALLEFVVELMPKTHGTSWLDAAKLKTPGLPALQSPGLPALQSRTEKKP